jgi:hypothetical protein
MTDIETDTRTRLNPGLLALLAADAVGKTVVVDLDGTAALFKHHRGPYEYHRVGEDLPNREVVFVVELLAAIGMDVVFLSGRENVTFATNEKFNEDYPDHGLTSGTCFAFTETWLHEAFRLDAFELYMRAEGDRRTDHVVKRELLAEHLDGRDVFLFLDDRNQVVNAWRELGRVCWQVADGNF